MPELATNRCAAVDSLISDVRAIVNAAPLDRDAVACIRGRIPPLAARREFWAAAEYPVPREGESQDRYLIGQDGPRGIPLDLSLLRRGRRIPPHNHTTWARVAAVEGAEHNTLGDRLDDGTVPGKARI